MTNPRKLKDVYVAIHGHFYQPPRENPWLEDIEAEDSASPFHDWNERIAFECYRPNAYARIVDHRGRILCLVNNYASINFNLGPTLLSWLGRKQPRVYRRIINADRESLRRFGHGNAIAQAYHHVILPLSSERDRETEVLWGMADFEKRFHRKPESIWLPETAVNTPTLEVLVKYGMKYLILSPFQALRVRPFGARQWTDVAGGRIDPTQPYRCFLTGLSGKTSSSDQFIDIFFYDGKIAKEVSFGDSLRDGNTFCQQFVQAYQPSKGRPQLIHIATDGETYGHHKKFGDMTLAYALGEGFSSRGMEVINYGAFLKRFPPVNEVEINEGAKGEGTSWSCVHGVGRWKEDCGCSTGGRTGWNQKWREPLRAALNRVRDELGLIFEREGESLFKDVWEARNGYIDVILDRSPAPLDHFFDQYGNGKLDEEERIKGLKLLEMERHTLKMLTSCGWFFADLAGLETVLILEQAARAIQLAEELTGVVIEERFLRWLSEAKSNLPEMGNGQTVYRNLVKPRVVTLEKVVNQFAIASLPDPEKAERKIFSYRVERLNHEKMERDHGLLILGEACVTPEIIPEKKGFLFALFSSAEDLLRTWISDQREAFHFDQLREKALEGLDKGKEDLFRTLSALLRNHPLTIRDVFQEERKTLFKKLAARELDEHLRAYSKLFEKSRPRIEALAREGLEIPYEILVAAEVTLSNRLLHETEELQRDLKGTIEKRVIDQIVEEATEYGYRLRTEEPLRILNEILRERIEEVRKMVLQDRPLLPGEIQQGKLQELIMLMDLAKNWGLEPRKEELQDIMGEILDKFIQCLEQYWWDNGAGGKTASPGLAALAERLGFNIERFMKMVQGPAAMD